jgi:alkanesulfonate monooxygenase SsuD/methylene tetrahydromethanopterin reductase-like flavin-dependent oxidoreductase (luciferase family)
MTIEVGYLLPTRERIVIGVHETGPILALADRAEAVGLDCVWIGDSLLAKPRHEPLALIAAIAGRTRSIRMGTAVLLPMLRNPVLLAHQAATIDRIAEGRMILGFGTARDIPPIRMEFEAAGVPFEKRIGLMLEQMRLCRALWSGEKVDWDGRWTVRGGELAPTPHTPGGPPLWGGGGVPAALLRAGRYFDGWFPSGAGTPEEWGRKWREIKAHAADAGRDASRITGAVYTTVAINDDDAKANAELDHYLEGYYNQPAEMIRRQQYSFAGDRAAVTAWLSKFVEGGASHLAVRFTGTDDERQMEILAQMRDELS